MASAVLAALGIAPPLPAADPAPRDAIANGLMQELRGATAVQVLLVSEYTLYAVAPVDSLTARGRVHRDACRYVTDDAVAVSTLLDIVDEGLVTAGRAVYAFGQGGVDVRAGLLFEKDGRPLKALYVVPTHSGSAPGLFDDGWIRMRVDIRPRIEAWLAQPQVRYAGGKDDARRPVWRYANGEAPLPCTSAEAKAPPDALHPSPPPRASPELKAAFDAALKNRDITAARFQAACERDTSKSPFCQCLHRELPGPYSLDNDGWSAYTATLAQGRYASETNPWYPAQQYSDQERREIFDLTDAATKSCAQDSTPPPIVGPATPIGYPPTPPPPPIGARTQ
jgi:hypothetical protein